jgi:hypothetical protein
LFHTSTGCSPGGRLDCRRHAKITNWRLITSRRFTVPFVGDPDWKLMDYRASWLDGDRVVNVEVSWDAGGGDGLFVAMVDGVPHPIDEEADLLDLAPRGAVLTFDRGGVTISIWRDGEDAHASASAVVEGRPRTATVGVHTHGSTAIESALRVLGEVDPSRAAPRVCFFCAHSDYEPSTGYGGGHLACFVASAEQYRAIAISKSAWERKYDAWGADANLRFRWVDEHYTCPLWERRPLGHGYRG